MSLALRPTVRRVARDLKNELFEKISILQSTMQKEGPGQKSVGTCANPDIQTKTPANRELSLLEVSYIVVGRMRFELTITAVSRRYPNQLDYRPIN